MINRLKEFFPEPEDNIPGHQHEDGFCNLFKVCISCGADKNLRAYAHGNMYQQMVGVLIFCNSCYSKYGGKDLKIDINVKPK